jgi:WD40 repeat protein
MRFGTGLFRLTDHTRGVALSPDGKRIAAYQRWDSIVLLDTATGKEIRRFITRGHSGESLVFSPDGKQLAAGGHGQGIILFDVTTGNQVRQFRSAGRGIQQLLCFSNDGKIFVAADMDLREKTPMIAWDVATGKEIGRLEAMLDHGAHLSLSKDGKLLASWGGIRIHGRNAAEEGNGTIQIWDVTASKELRQLKVPESQIGVANIALSPDGKQLAIADMAAITLVETETGKQIRRFATRSGAGNLLVYSPDGKRLASAALEGAVQVWDPATGKRLPVGKGPQCRCFGLAFTSETEILAAGINGQAVRIWEVSTGKVLGPKGGHQAAVTSVGFLKGGRNVISVGADGIRTWSVAAGKQLNHITLKFERDRGMPAVGFLSPNGRYLLQGEQHVGAIRLVETETGEEAYALNQSFSLNPTAAFSADGKTLATFSGPGRREQHISIHDVESGQEVRSFEGTAGDSHCLALSPDGKFLAEASLSHQNPQMQSSLRLWDTAAGKEVRKIQQAYGHIQAVAFSPDGAILAAAGQGGTHLYDAVTGAELRTLDDGQRFTTSNLTFSPDGRLLAIGVAQAQSEEHKLFVWEVASGSARHEFTRSQGGVLTLAFSPDSRTLVSGGADTTVLLWDVAGRSAEGATATKPTAEEMQALWSALIDPDAGKGHRALLRLTAAPGESVTLLKQHLQPAQTATFDVKEIEKLIDDLDNDSFTTREKATRELKRVGRPAKAPLEKALAANPEPEKRRRLEAILQHMMTARTTPESIRSTRALELLERLNTSESREFLVKLANGARDALLTREAKNALARLDNLAADAR